MVRRIRGKVFGEVHTPDSRWSIKGKGNFLKQGFIAKMKWSGEGATGEDGSEKPETKKREFGQERKGVWDAWNDLELVEKALAESAGMVTIFSPLFVNLI